MTIECSHMDCRAQAVWVTDVDNSMSTRWYKATAGTYYYCDAHKIKFEEMIPTMKFKEI